MLLVSRAICGATDAPERCRKLLDGLYGLTCELISEHRDALGAISRTLVEREALPGAEAEALIDAALSKERQDSA